MTKIAWPSEFRVVTAICSYNHHQKAKRRSAINAPPRVTQLGHTIITCWCHPFTLHNSLLNHAKCVTSAHWVGATGEKKVLHLLIAQGGHIAVRDHIANTSRDQYRVCLDSLKDLSAPWMSPCLWPRWIISPMLWRWAHHEIPPPPGLLHSLYYLHMTSSFFLPISSGSPSILSHSMITLWSSRMALHPSSIKGRYPRLFSCTGRSWCQRAILTVGCSPQNF